LPANRKDILLRKLGAKELSDLNLSELKKHGINSTVQRINSKTTLWCKQVCLKD